MGGGGVPILPIQGQPAPLRPEEYGIASIPDLLTFSFTGIAPPAGLYVQKDDILNLSCISSIVGELVHVSIRFLRLDLPLGGQPDSPRRRVPEPGSVVTGTIITIAQDVALPTIRTIGSINLFPGEGFILSVNAFCVQSSTRGRTFARVGIFRAPIAVPQFTQVFISDYITNSYSTAWPSGTQRSPQEGPGFIHSVQVGNPAAGADWIFTAPATSRMRIASFNAVFTASAAVANRTVSIVIDDGVNTVWTDDLSAAITASQVINMSLTTLPVLTGSIVTTLHATLPPGLIMPGSFRMRTVTNSIQAGDQWSAIWLNVEEWLDF